MGRQYKKGCKQGGRVDTSEKDGREGMSMYVFAPSI